jgi:hypothetical protein
MEGQKYHRNLWDVAWQNPGLHVSLARTRILESNSKRLRFYPTVNSEFILLFSVDWSSWHLDHSLDQPMDRDGVKSDSEGILFYSDADVWKMKHSATDRSRSRPYLNLTLGLGIQTISIQPFSFADYFGKRDLLYIPIYGALTFSKNSYINWREKNYSQLTL